MSNGKTVSDKDKKSLKSRIASIKRSVVSPKYIAKELKGLGLTASKIKEIKEKLKDKKYYTTSKIRNILGTVIPFVDTDKELRNRKLSKKLKKANPHLKHGGKAKKMRTYKKGGKAK